MNEDQIKKMVDRFLTWRLPEDFNPDAGISFKKTFNEHTPFPMKHEPTGTNLFDAMQATAMVRHMVEGLPAHSTPLAAQETRQVAWLIEHKGYAGSTLPHWYAENEDAIAVHASLAMDPGVARSWHWWTPTASEAKRFASMAEAEAFPPYQMIASDPAISITEHVFIASPAPDKCAVTEAMVEIAAKAMDDAEFGFSLRLTRLVDGVSTYELTYSDGSPQLEFEDTDQAYEHVAQRKRLTQARAALTAAVGAGSGAEHG